MKKPLVFTNYFASRVYNKGAERLDAKIAIAPESISMVLQPIEGCAGQPNKVATDHTQVFRHGVEHPIHVAEPYAQVLEMWLNAIADEKR